MSVSLRKPARWVVISALTALAAACAAGPQTPPQTSPSPSDPNGQPSQVDPLAPYEPSGNASMDAWRASFAARASANGRDARAIRAVLEGITPLDLYLSETVTTQSAIEEQAEFAKPIWEYLRTAVSESRRVNGAELLAGSADLWTGLESRYGVDREALVAIWGMETNFGSYIGTFDAANTLANMAVEGRRRTFAENELLALMKILERGDAVRADFVSGWAGAMGQTQFMPTTYLTHAEDFDGDGRKDIWRNTGDALASAAHYMSMSGYEFGEPWGLEVTLPPDFDYSLADGRERRVQSWQAQGVTIVDTARGAGISDGKYGELWIPAGYRGPKFLLFKNFNVFKTYNRADSYALAVGLLSDAVAGRPGLSTPWPSDLQPLTVAQVKQMQAALNLLGYDAGPVDGIAGRGTKGALRRFQAERGFIADGYPTTEMLAYVLSAASN